MIYSTSLFTQQEHRLLLQHIEALKQVMRDIQSYGITWLQGEDRNNKAVELQRLNTLLLLFQGFIMSIEAPATWLNLYSYLRQHGVQPIKAIFQCIEGLERLINDITISMNNQCSVVLYPSMPLECAHATMQQRNLKQLLITISNEIIGCKLARDSLFYVLIDLNDKIELYKLIPIDGLNEIIQRSFNLCTHTKRDTGNRR